MKDQSKTKQALIEELASLRESITELEQSESERKRVDDAVSLQSEILANMKEGVHLTRVDDNVIVFANRSIECMFGYDPDELVGKHVSILNAPDIKSPEAAAIEIIRSLEQTGVWNGEVHNIRKDGTSFWCYANVSKFKHQQYGEVWISVHQDITNRKQAEEARRQSEENFRRSLDESPLGVRIVTVEGETIYANQTIINIYGYDSIEELKNTPVEKRYTPKSYLEFQMRREQRRHGFEDPSEYVISIIRKDGSVRHLQVYRKGILWNNKRQYQVLYFDITERKQAEEELKNSQQQLRALAARLQEVREESRIMISQEIHDELGGGLTELKMDLASVLHKVSDGEASKERIALKSKIQTVMALIDQLIQVVRRIATELRPSVLDDLGLVAALEWQLEEFTSRIAIPHKFTTAFDDVTLERGTATAVFRIFQEALTNVARHSGATQVTVCLLEEDGSLVLEIRDNGRGITESEIQNKNSLGILGMKERAMVFGGTLSVFAEPDGGTAVILNIPQKQGRTS